MQWSSRNGRDKRLRNTDSSRVSNLDLLLMQWPCYQTSSHCISHVRYGVKSPKCTERLYRDSSCSSHKIQTQFRDFCSSEYCTQYMFTCFPGNTLQPTPLAKRYGWKQDQILGCPKHMHSSPWQISPTFSSTFDSPLSHPQFHPCCIYWLQSLKAWALLHTSTCV